MFTGLVEEVGRVIATEGNAQSGKITVQASKVLAGVKLGDSIAVNGVCLTVTSFDKQQFTVDVMPETFVHTNLGRLERGGAVNLERAMAMGDRFGGHLVSGHVDGIGTIRKREAIGNAVLFRIETDASLLRYMVPRGSVALDGISLTLVDVGDTYFSVSIIPHTLAQTSLLNKRPGNTVNLECDAIAKYVERLLSFQSEKGRGNASTLTLDYLSQHGFA